MLGKVRSIRFPEGLTGRPELASQQALVKATIDRLKQERMRPLIPSLVLQGAANPADTLGAGFYEANATGRDPTWTGRSDWDFQVVWQLQNLGAGNTGLVHERKGEQRQAMIELFRLQDQVAAEIAQAWAQITAATTRIKEAEYGLAAAEVSFEGNLKGVSETIRGRSVAVAGAPAGSQRRLVAIATGVQQLLHGNQRLQSGGVPAVPRLRLSGSANHAKSCLGRCSACRLPDADGQ